MSRPKLDPPPCAPDAVLAMERFHADVVEEVRAALRAHEVVVVGMDWNTNVPRARRALEQAGIAYHYIGHGNYLTGWKQRLAIKLWSGWPTFPQVFVRGELLGGADQAQQAIAAGTLRGAAAA